MCRTSACVTCRHSSRAAPAQSARKRSSPGHVTERLAPDRGELRQRHAVRTSVLQGAVGDALDRIGVLPQFW